MTAESRARIEDPTVFGPTHLLANIRHLDPSDQKRAILDARQLGDIDDDQTEILIRVLGLEAA